MSLSIPKTSHVVLLLALCVLLAQPAAGEEIRTTLFAEADGLKAEALEVRANVLAPKSWGQAMEHYTDAERKLTAGENLEEIRKDLDRAAGYFRDAIKATDLAKVTMEKYLKARDDAAKVDAAHNASELWQKGEAKFAEAGRKLEEGKINDARKKGAEAEALFRDAELSAIKTSFFAETRNLLARAKDEKVDKYAPLTLARSQSLLDEAERALNENRYDTDRPRTLAMEAKYEAQHALHLAKLVKMTNDEVMTREELLLEAEKPLTRVAGSLDVLAAFDEGFTTPTETIIAAIEAQEAELDRLASELNDRDARIAGLTEQVAQLETKLGGASEAEKALQAQVEAQELARQRFEQVEQEFTREEARVLRESGAVVIRLVGMNFASGQAVIRPDHFPLLTKVKDAIAIYPDALISIEGHTDAYGTDEANLKLSQLRADAVAQYLLANSNLSPNNVRATGFGETHPIANNETKEGRAKNRRIDVVIKPAK
jgi:outer membrane protein OmpA-like peptidoglycan-associated protein